jgi:drug/metabolite transporter (DMT)-like permease
MTLAAEEGIGMVPPGDGDSGLLLRAGEGTRPRGATDILAQAVNRGRSGTIAARRASRRTDALSQAVALLALHAAVLLFGFAGLFGKWLALSPVAIVLGRTAIAAAALLLVRQWRGVGVPFDLRLAANGIVLAVHWVSFFAAIQVASVAIGLLGFASFPLFTLAFERALLGKHWTRHEGMTAILVVGGLLLLVPELAVTNPTVQGLGLGIVSGATFALLAVLNRRWATERSATDIAFWQNFLAALVLLPVAWVDGPSLGTVGTREILLLLLLGLVCTALAHTLFIGALSVVTAHTASVVAALEPVYGVALAFMLLGEAPDARTVAGGALLVVAAVVATRNSANPNSVGGERSIG